MRVRIVDTTLRDGEQTAGVVFSAAEKLAIAQALNRAGVAAIEAGTPAMGTMEQAALRAIVSAGLQADVIAWNRAVPEDIAAAVQCGFAIVHISVPVSDLHITAKLQKSRDWVLHELEQAILLAKSFGCRVLVGAEDASRAEPDFFLATAAVAARLGAERIRFADTVGCLDPFGVDELLRSLLPRCPLPLEFHAHNDIGLATANTLAAVRAGAEWVSVTVNGIGERAGNAGLQQVVSGLTELYDCDSGVEQHFLTEAGNLVTACVNRSWDQQGVTARFSA